MDGLSLKELHYLVLSGIWRNDRRMQTKIYDRYKELSRTETFSGFGTPEFWSVVKPIGRVYRSVSEEGCGPIKHPVRCRRCVSLSAPDQVGGAVTRRRQLDPGFYRRLAGLRASWKEHPISSTTSDEDITVKGENESPVKRKRRSVKREPSGYTFTETDRVYVRRFRTMGQYFKLEFTNEEETMDSVRKGVTEAINRGFHEAPDGLVGLAINHVGLERPILIPFSDKEKLTTDNALNLVEAVLQSAHTVKIGSAMEIKVVSVNPPKAAGSDKASRKAVRFLGAKAPCVIRIINNDRLCVARSIAYMMARHRRHDSSEARRNFARIRRQDKGGPRLRTAARELMKNAGIAEGEYCSIHELKHLQTVVPYQIKCWTLDLELFFEGEKKGTPPICLLFTDGNHCNPIRSLPRFLNRSYYCHSCNKGYSWRLKHRCASRCSHCYSNGGECTFTGWIECVDCSRYFPSLQCLNRHKLVTKGAKKSICQQIFVCRECRRYVYSTDEHRCGEVKCGVCKQWDEPNWHQWNCYMQRIESSDDDEDGASESNSCFLFYDIESSQDTRYSEDSFIHIPNYIIAQKVCDKYKEGWTKQTVCSVCTEAERTFSGDNCITEFTEWLLTEQHCGRLVFAHNSKAFDSQFVLQAAVKKGLIPKIVPRGFSIMSMEIQGIRFLDSHCFLPMPLAALPAAFGFADEVVKGAFAHYFNSSANQNYVGPFPALEYYGVDEKQEDDRRKLIEWHAEQTGKTFHFREEIHKYCSSDVTILRRAVLEFRRIFIENTQIDPFERSITIASACSRVFRRHFLPEATIGIVPHNGYRRAERQSVTAIKWLKWLAYSRGIKIQHARNSGERKIAGYKVDGFAPAINTVFEFQGCPFHGCLCIKDRHKNVPGSTMTMTEAYNATLIRRQTITQAGFTYEEIWSCAFEREKANNPEMRSFIDAVSITTPLDPRGCFYGGVNPVRLFVEADGDETLEYADICSLYPTVLKQCAFPLGHPEVITECFEEITRAYMPYFGIIKCSILAPFGLYHPLLPYRCCGKLMFPLCRTCCETQQQEECAHNDTERMLHGEWVSVEIEKALQLGYRITKLDEVWHYDERSDPSDTDGFFSGYVNTWLRLKTQSSGFPSWVKSKRDEKEYVRSFAKAEGVKLDRKAIKKNPGLRAISKLCLNSF